MPYVLLKPWLPVLKAHAQATGDASPLQQCEAMAERRAEIDAAPGLSGPERSAW